MTAQRRRIDSKTSDRPCVGETENVFDGGNDGIKAIAVERGVEGAAAH